MRVKSFNKGKLVDEIISLCAEYDFNFDNGFLSSSKLERQQILAKISSRFEHEKSKASIITMIGIIVAIGLFITELFFGIKWQLGVIYVVVIVGMVYWVLSQVRLHLKLIKDLSYLKELFTIYNSEEDAEVCDEQLRNCNPANKSRNTEKIRSDLEVMLNFCNNLEVFSQRYFQGNKVTTMASISLVEELSDELDDDQLSVLKYSFEKKLQVFAAKSSSEIGRTAITIAIFSTLIAAIGSGQKFIIGVLGLAFFIIVFFIMREKRKAETDLKKLHNMLVCIDLAQYRKKKNSEFCNLEEHQIAEDD